MGESWKIIYFNEPFSMLKLPEDTLSVLTWQMDLQELTPHPVQQSLFCAGPGFTSDALESISPRNTTGSGMPNFKAPLTRKRAT